MNSTTGDFSEIRKSRVSNEIIYNRDAHSTVKKKTQNLILRPLNFIDIKKAIEEELDNSKVINELDDGKQILSAKVSDNDKERIQANLTIIQEEDLRLLRERNDTLLKDVTNHRNSQSARALHLNNDEFLMEKPKNTLCLSSKASCMSQVKENINHPREQKNDSFDLDFSALSLSTPVKQSGSSINSTSNIKTEHTREHFQHFITPKPNTTMLKNQCSLSKKSFLKTPISSFNSVSARKLVTPCKPQKISPTVLENFRDFKKEDKTNNSTCPNDSKDTIVTPANKIPVIFSETRLPNHEESQWPIQTNSLSDDTFKRIKVNNIQYIMFGLLGRGGSSEVYQCYNVESKIHVAIKCVSLQNPATANGYINEVKLLQQLQNCDKIIKMYDYEILETQKKLLVVLENGGKDLSTILKQLASQKSHIPMYMLLFYWMEMLYAVRQIHSNGIIHSDLKPANFLKVDGGLKLIDFGIASSVQTDMTSVIKTKQEGSCNYISPEALNSDSANFSNTSTEKYKIHYKSDVWSLGCILYQFVYRRTPFEHITKLWPKFAAIMNPKHEIDYPHVDWVSPKIISTIKKCLQYNVKLRPSVEELITEYDSIMHNI